MGFARSSCVPQYFHADIMIKRRKLGSALLVGDKILIDFLIDLFVLTQRLQHNIAKRFLISHFILLLPLLREIEQPIHLRLNVRAMDTDTARTRSFCVLQLCPPQYLGEYEFITDTLKRNRCRYGWREWWGW